MLITIESTVVLRLNTKASTDCTDQITLDVADATNDIAITKGNTTFLSAELDTLSSFSIDLSSRVAARALATDVNTLETNLGLSASNIRALREDVTSLDTSVTDCLNSLTATTLFSLTTAAQAITERAILTDFNTLETTVTKQGISATNLCTTIDSLNTTLAGVTGGTLGVNVSSIQNLESRVNFQSAFINSVDTCTTTINNNVTHGACALNLLSAFFNPKIEETCSNLTNLAISAGGQINFVSASLTGLEDSTMLSAGLFESFFSQVRTTSANQDSSITTAQSDITNNRTQFNSATAEFRHDIQFLSGGINHSTCGLKAISASQQASITNLDGEITLVRNVTGDIQDELDSTTAITLNERTIVRAQTGVLNTSINQVDTNRQADRTQANALSSNFEGRIAGSESDITGLNNCVANEHSMINAITGRFDTALANQVSGFEFYLGVGTLTGALNTAQNNTQGEVNAFIKNPDSQFRILTAGLESNIVFLSSGLEANFLTAGADSSMIRTITGGMNTAIDSNYSQLHGLSSSMVVLTGDLNTKADNTEAKRVNDRTQFNSITGEFRHDIQFLSGGITHSTEGLRAVSAIQNTDINAVKSGLEANFLSGSNNNTLVRVITGDLLGRIENSALSGQQASDVAFNAFNQAGIGVCCGNVAKEKADCAKDVANAAGSIAEQAAEDIAAANNKIDSCHSCAVTLINNENTRVTTLEQIVGETDGRGGGSGLQCCVANLKNDQINQGIKLTSLENDVALVASQEQTSEMISLIGENQAGIKEACCIAVNAGRRSDFACREAQQACGVARSSESRVINQINKLKSKYALEVNAGGKVASMVIAACYGSERNARSCVGFEADCFFIGSQDSSTPDLQPFVVENNRVKIDGADIRDLSVQRISIGDEVVSEANNSFFCTGVYLSNRFGTDEIMRFPESYVRNCRINMQTGVSCSCCRAGNDAYVTRALDIFPQCRSINEHQPDAVGTPGGGYTGVGFGGTPGYIRITGTGRPVQINLNTFNEFGQHVGEQCLCIYSPNYCGSHYRADSARVIHFGMEYQIVRSAYGYCCDLNVSDACILAGGICGLIGTICGFNGSVVVSPALLPKGQTRIFLVDFRPIVNYRKGDAYAVNKESTSIEGEPFRCQCYSCCMEYTANQQLGGGTNTIKLQLCGNSYKNSYYNGEGCSIGSEGQCSGCTLKYVCTSSPGAVVTTCNMCVSLEAVSLFK